MAGAAEGAPSATPSHYIFQWVVCTFGMLANLLVLVTYLRKQHKVPSETFIIAMAVVDFSMNFFGLVFTVVRLFDISPVILHFCVFSNAVFDIVNSGSCLLVCCMTVNRFVAICHPHTYSAFFSAARVRALLVGVAALATCSATPSVSNCFIYFHPSAAHLTPGAGEPDRVKLSWVLMRILLVLFAALLMAVLYCKVGLELRRQKLKQDVTLESSTGLTLNCSSSSNIPPTELELTMQLNERSVVGDRSGEEGEEHNFGESSGGNGGDGKCGRNRRLGSSVSNVINSRSYRERRNSRCVSDRNLTLTLFVVSVVYISLSIPDIIVNLLDSFSFFSANHHFEKYRVMTQAVATVNFVTNPVIYLACNTYFKSQLRALLRPDCPLYQPTNA